MNDLVQLNEILPLLGLSERIAKRKAALGLLPLPAFRLSGTKKGPLFVRKSDLDNYIQRTSQSAMRLHELMIAADLV